MVLAAALLALAALVPASGLAQSETADFSDFTYNSTKSYSLTRIPRGLWSDGTTVWWPERAGDGKSLAAHTLATGARDSDKDIPLDADNEYPAAGATDGTTMWVLDTFDEKLYAYTLSTGDRDSDKDISLHLENRFRKWGDMWSDGTTIWVMYQNGVYSKLFAYTLEGGDRDSDKDISLDWFNSDPWGLWSDETTMWVNDMHDKKLYAYTLSTGDRDSDKDFDLHSSNSRSWGVYFDGTTLWVGDLFGRKVYAYERVGGV